MTRFTYDGDPLRFAARAGGKRVKKTEGATPTVYIEAIYEKNVTTGVTTTYYYEGAMRVAMRQRGVLYYLHGDHLGSTSAVSSITGTLVARQLYTPYGAPRWSSGTLPTDYRYTGQRAETGLGSLYDYGARFYSPSLNRWLQPDTIASQPGNPQSLNRYSYVLNSPLNYTDPTGHHEECSVAEGCGMEGTWSPPPSHYDWVLPPSAAVPAGLPTPPPPPQPNDPLARLYGNADYYGAAVNINVRYPVMIVGLGLSYVQPEVGLPVTLVGAALAKSSLSTGVSVEWNQYGDTWISFPNLALGKTLGGTPVSGDFFAGRILTGRNEPATQNEAQDFLSGPSSSASGGAAQLAIGGTVSWTAKNKIGVERHIMWPPQVGVTLFSWGFLLPKYE